MPPKLFSVINKFGSGSIFCVFASVAFILIGIGWGIRKKRTQCAMTLRLNQKCLQKLTLFKCKNVFCVNRTLYLFTISRVKSCAGRIIDYNGLYLLLTQDTVMVQVLCISCNLHNISAKKNAYAKHKNEDILYFTWEMCVPPLKVNLTDASESS